MEKVKQQIKKIMTDNKIEKVIDFEDLKIKINNLLHCNLPDDITIKEADVLAMVIFNMITSPGHFLTNKEE